MATPRGATTRGGCEGAAALGRRRGRGDGGSCWSGVVNEDDDAEEGNRLDGRGGTRSEGRRGGARSTFHPGLRRHEYRGGASAPRGKVGVGEGSGAAALCSWVPKRRTGPAPAWGCSPGKTLGSRRGLGFPKGPDVFFCRFGEDNQLGPCINAIYLLGGLMFNQIEFYFNNKRHYCASSMDCFRSQQFVCHGLNLKGAVFFTFF
jgi:hypothetical protein